VAKSPSEAEAAHYWLTNSQARDHLNPQLAQLLRQFVEHRALSYEPEFNWCPACGRPLLPFEQPDVWVQGLACENGHEFAARGGHINGSLGGERISLLSEYSAKALQSVVGGWLKPNPLLAPQMHATVRNILEHYASGQAATV
jgi:alkanesulfonate monooxygenase SsuD/methylene tetrahydromethanopterin reductase-like flavin-dependent oxidoreductase (luciferase family)